MHSVSSKTIFAFDMGLASLGEAVRKGDKIVHAASLEIDANVGATKTQSLRRRAYKGREAHKKREEWLEKIWLELKLPGLLRGRSHQKKETSWEVRPGDEKLEREFAIQKDKKRKETKASKGDMIYTSCLLRIMLLQNKEKLEPWQVYKALRSAIQRRGYDLHVPWAKREEAKKKTKDKEDEKHYERQLSEFKKELQEMSSQEKHHYPCYYDAWRMGLWDPKSDSITPIQDNTATRARGYTASRDYVE